MPSVCCWGWAVNLSIHLWVDLICRSFDSSSTEWERLMEGGPTYNKPGGVSTGGQLWQTHTLTQLHTCTDTNVENQWIYCTCLNRLELHYMDMKCENTHNIYLPTHYWIYITHTHLYTQTPSHMHTHTKHTIFTPAYTKYGLNIFIHVYRHKWS